MLPARFRSTRKDAEQEHFEEANAGADLVNKRPELVVPGVRDSDPVLDASMVSHGRRLIGI